MVKESIHDIIARNVIMAFENNLKELTLRDVSGKLLHIPKIFFEHMSKDIHKGYITAEIPLLNESFSIPYDNKIFIDKFTGIKESL